jgi:hypothetical protein
MVDKVFVHLELNQTVTSPLQLRQTPEKAQYVLIFSNYVTSRTYCTEEVGKGLHLNRGKGLTAAVR